MEKSKRLVIRCSQEFIELVTQSAQEQNTTTSNYVRKALEASLCSKTHEQIIHDSLSENRFIASLLNDPSLPLKYKKQIGKKVRNHVTDHN